LVYINQVSLTHFKSFGGSVTIPLETGFTVVTGPNGSGKSNILDGILFCLGLANSRGMRAERLPDLINHGVLREGKAAEASVSVRFDLTDWQPDEAEAGLDEPCEGPWIKPGQQEWTVTRRLRVAAGGTYSSSYSADGIPCNLQQLQTQLRRLRVDPDGSNVVMQGDVTRIVSMAARERRGIIDELAGVALFDSRIDQARNKLEEVQEREDRCRIVEGELQASRSRLERDCQRARLYQELRQKLQFGRQQEQVLQVEETRSHLVNLEQQQQQLQLREIHEKEAIQAGEIQILTAATALEQLQQEVKSLGEDQLLKVQGQLAELDAAARERQRRAERHQQESSRIQQQRHQLLQERGALLDQQRQLEGSDQSQERFQAQNNCVNAEAAVELSRRRLGEVAGRSGSWLEEQQLLSRRRLELVAELTPLQAEQLQLDERCRQDQQRQLELELQLGRERSEVTTAQQRLQHLQHQLQQVLQGGKAHRNTIQEKAEALSLQQRTCQRLEQEQQQLEREIARQDSRRETLQESRGTGALRVLLEAGMEGIHGPVAQLGEVEERFRHALEVAAGGRLTQVVVDNDQIAARAIELLKQRRAGRLTFLPLNKVRAISSFSSSSSSSALEHGAGIATNFGCLGRALELLRFEPVYGEVFRYVFGETLVYQDLEAARRELGRSRIVTLDGELLERSGAITGGSQLQRSFGLSFGRVTEGDEAEPLRRRLLELGETLVACKRKEQELAASLEELQAALNTQRSQQAAFEAELAALQRAHGPLLNREAQLQQRLEQLQTSLKNDADRLQQLNAAIAPLEQERGAIASKEANAGQQQDGARWSELQQELEQADVALRIAREQKDQLEAQQRETSLVLARLQSQLEALAENEKRSQIEAASLTAEVQELRQQQLADQTNRVALETEQQELQTRFGEQRRARDQAEALLASQRQEQQQHQWDLERLGEQLQALSEEKRNFGLRLHQMEQALPNPLPELPEELREAGLAALQEQLKVVQQRMEALEPVNMLALEELEQLETRLAELAERLAVLASERLELLLRVETVATLRQEAFMEAFRAVDGHFREIFAGLSEGEGQLQLENEADPLEGGLTLVAHPKGKAVRRLASMSGGEKSLTALSFLFALQRFRPSPFYAFDEVDSFLDGVNVDRLAGLISSQADAAQFLVVSHRRPMIAASTRTIGVTQARGAHTQVVGLPSAA
jgi:chromosome segregation protein